MFSQDEANKIYCLIKKIDNIEKEINAPLLHEKMIGRLNDKFRFAFLERVRGRTFISIAKDLGLTSARASQMYRKALRMMNYPTFLRGLVVGELDEWERNVIDIKRQIEAGEITPIESLDLSVRAYNCLKRAGYCFVESLVNLDASQVLGIRNLGRRCTDEVSDKLKVLGYAGWDFEFTQQENK